MSCRSGPGWAVRPDTAPTAASGFIRVRLANILGEYHVATCAETSFRGAVDHIWPRVVETVKGAQVQDVLALTGILQGVASDAAAALVGELEQVTFPPRYTVFTEGEPGVNLYIMLAGKVKIRRKTTDGRETLIAVLGPTDIFGELALFDPGPRTSTVTTLTEVHTAQMDRRALRAWISAYPDVAQQLLRVLARRLRRTNDALCDLIFTDVPGRVSKQLLELASRFGTNSGQTLSVDLDLTQEELAQLVGSSRETVNKALSDFSQRGWIRQQGRMLSILAPDKLAHRAR